MAEPRECPCGCAWWAQLEHNARLNANREQCNSPSRQIFVVRRKIGDPPLCNTVAASHSSPRTKTSSVRGYASCAKGLVQRFWWNSRRKFVRRLHGATNLIQKGLANVDVMCIQPGNPIRFVCRMRVWCKTMAREWSKNVKGNSRLTVRWTRVVVLGLGYKSTHNDWRFGVYNATGSLCDGLCVVWWSYPLVVR